MMRPYTWALRIPTNAPKRGDYAGLTSVVCLTLAKTQKDAAAIRGPVASYPAYPIGNDGPAFHPFLYHKPRGWDLFYSLDIPFTPEAGKVYVVRLGLPDERTNEVREWKMATAWEELPLVWCRDS